MKKFLLGLLCGVVIVFLCGIVLLFAAIRFTSARPVIADNSVLVLRLEGEIPEKAPLEIPLPAFEDQAHLTVRDVWSELKRAAGDSRIKAVAIVPRHLSVGWAKLQEIRDSLVAFKKSGKPVYALLRFPGTRDYYVATAADKIYAGPEDYLDLKGLRLEAMYLKGTLNKLGVEMDVIHAGKYKDAYDMFTRTSMTPETREVLNQVLDLYYTNLVQTIASGRKKDPAAVRALIDQGPFVAEDALKAGLLDVLGYEDQAMGDLQGRVNQSSLKKIDGREYLRALAPEISGTRFALLVAQGAITQGGGEQGFGGEEGIRSGTLTKQLRRLKSDSTIKGVIVRIDSPGGDAIASDDILHEMKELSRSKPVVISMSDVAASGGYFMAVTGDPIVAYPNTLTGSIGVITAKPNLHGLYDKLGISKELLTRGRFAALDSDYKPLDEAEKAKLSESVEATYRGFINRVATGRRRSYEQIAGIAEGRVWVGTQAKDNGLVDQLGGLDAALDLLRQKAKLAANEKVVLVPYPPRRSLFDVLMSHSEDSSLTEVKLNSLLARVPGGRWIRPALDGGMLMLMPYSVDVR
jgi:protease IV